MQSLLFLLLTTVTYKTPHFSFQGDREVARQIAPLVEKGFKKITKGLFLKPKGEKFSLQLHSHLSFFLCPKGDSPTLHVSLSWARYRQFQSLFHQLTHHVLRRHYPHLPPWLQEGLATYWGSPVLLFSQKRLFFGLPVFSLLRSLEELPSFESLVDLSKDRFFGKHLPRHRAMSWLVVHYLYTKQPKKLKNLLLHTQEHREIYYTLLFGDLDKFQKQVHQHLMNLKKEWQKRESLFQKAKKQFQNKQYKKAIRSLTRLLLKAPYHTQGRYLRGLCYQKEKDYSKALSDFLFLLNLGTDHPLIHLEIAKIYFFQNRRKKAKKHIQKAKELAPKNSLILEWDRKINR